VSKRCIAARLREYWCHLDFTQTRVRKSLLPLRQNNGVTFWFSLFTFDLYMYRKLISFLLSISLLLPATGMGQSVGGAKPADAEPGRYLPLLKRRHVALVVNQSARVGDKLLPDALLARHVKVVKIFVPEHGFRGKEDAGAKVDNARDEATGLPIVSLYGKHKKPLPEDLADVDVVVYDLQDVGVRFYTYISTLEYVMEACAENGKPLIVLDRPNPNGFYVDGPVLEKENSSFVGMQPIPIVYGMTCGEYARMLQGEGWFAHAADLQLTVIPCSGYVRQELYELPVVPSPNLRNTAAVLAYPSLCLFEGTPISVGRGTDLPFQQFGCPEFEGLYDYAFVPQSVEGAKHPPYEGKRCFGAVIGVTPQEVLGRTHGKLCLSWLIRTYHDYPDKDKFFTPFFTKLAGTAKLAEQIKRGESEEAIRDSWVPGVDAFLEIRKKYLLYGE
jgi:uncharacterized protein YbbC (DUF1343 family)